MLGKLCYRLPLALRSTTFRFYPTDSQNADKNGNTKPGTVVDKGVTGV